MYTRVCTCIHSGSCLQNQNMFLFNMLPTKSFIPPLLILVATVTSNLWQEKIFLPTYNSSFHAKQCLRCGMFLCRTKHLLCWAWARTQEWGWGGGMWHCAHQPFPSAGSSKASEGQALFFGSRYSVFITHFFWWGEKGAQSYFVLKDSQWGQTVSHGRQGAASFGI